MKKANACLATLLLLAYSGAFALNRCVAPDGTVSYSDRPCPSTEQQSKVKIMDSKGFVPERAPLPQVDAQRERADVEQRKDLTPDGGHARIGVSTDCKNAMRTYEAYATTRVKPSASDMEGARVAAQRACGKSIGKMAEQVSREDREEHKRIWANFCRRWPAERQCSAFP